MRIYLHFTSRKIIDKKTDIQNYTIARYQYTRKYKITNNNNTYKIKSIDPLMILKLLLEIWDVFPKSNVCVRS